MTLGICDLPPELLAAILKEGQKITVEDEVLSGVYDPTDGSPCIMPFEVLMTHICSTFRDVSLTTPSLWTTMHLYSGCSVGTILDRISRSGACELTIRLESGAQDVQINASKLDIVVDHIINESMRWNTLFCRYACERLSLPIVTRIFSAIAPKLQRLSLTIDDVIGMDANLINQSVGEPHIFRNGQSQLEFVRLRGFAIHFFRPRLSNVVTLHLDQVKSLTLQYSTLHQILTCSPFLVNLSIYGDLLPDGGWGNHQQRKIMSIPSLLSLRLYSESGEAYAGFLRTFDVPSLQSLTLKSLHENDLDALWLIPDLNLLFRNLTSLNFTEFDSDLSGLIYQRIFQTFQGISTFTAVWTTLAKSTLVRLLSEGQINGPYGLPYTPWPFLHTLGFTTDLTEEDQEIIDSIVEARKTCGHPISTFLLWVDGEEQVEAELMPGYQNHTDIDLRFCGGTPTWPEESSYLDLEDNLF